MIEFDDATPVGGAVLEGAKIGGTSTNIQIEGSRMERDRQQHHALRVHGRRHLRVGAAQGDQHGLPRQTCPGMTSRLRRPTRPGRSSGTPTSATPRTTPELLDGLRTVTIIAYDDLDRASVPMRRTFLVDNYPPSAAPVTTLTNSPKADLSQTLTLSWSEVLDGDRPADHYTYELYEKLSASQTITDWTPVGVSPSTKTAAAMPLAVYAARARGHSVLDKTGPWGASGCGSHAAGPQRHV